MTKPNDGGPAFPRTRDTEFGDGVMDNGSTGMSLRAWLAGQALPAVITKGPSFSLKQLEAYSEAQKQALMNTMHSVWAETACLAADALIAELETGHGD